MVAGSHNNPRAYSLDVCESEFGFHFPAREDQNTAWAVFTNCDRDGSPAEFTATTDALLAQYSISNSV